MALPYFFTDNLSVKELSLDEETSKHIVQVLRMQNDEQLLLTDGLGSIAEATITNAHKKHCGVKLNNTHFSPRSPRQLTIAISLIKNASRFDWFLEKATELGTAEIIPIICDRTERSKYRQDRMLNVCKSAMLQSMQCWMPLLSDPIAFSELVQHSSTANKFIAHCGDGNKKNLRDLTNDSLYSSLIIIGPEGDFTPTEINTAIEKNFTPVSLGTNRLRTETAGIYAAVMLS